MIKPGSILYVELKSGHSDDGPAWIGRARFSKSGRTIYFNGKAYTSAGGRPAYANYYEMGTGNEYWISAVKKNRQDRHWAGSGNIFIDRAVVQDYLALVGLDKLPQKQYKIVDLDNTDIGRQVTETANSKME
jgi:hypothetical protein